MFEVQRRQKRTSKTQSAQLSSQHNFLLVGVADSVLYTFKTMYLLLYADDDMNLCMLRTMINVSEMFRFQSRL